MKEPISLNERRYLLFYEYFSGPSVGATLYAEASWIFETTALQVVVGLGEVDIVMELEGLDGGSTTINGEDVGVEAASGHRNNNGVSRMVEGDGNLLTEAVFLVARRLHVDTSVDLDRQDELQVVGVFGGVDSHHND